MKGDRGNKVMLPLLLLFFLRCCGLCQIQGQLAEQGAVAMQSASLSAVVGSNQLLLSQTAHAFGIDVMYSVMVVGVCMCCGGGEALPV